MIEMIKKRIKEVFHTIKAYETAVTGKYNRNAIKAISHHLKSLNKWLNPLGLEVFIKKIEKKT